MVLPWLNPFAPGPAPNVAPLMFAWACVAILLAVAALHRPENQPTRLSGVAAGAWLAAAVLSCGIALLQYFGQTQVLGQWGNHTGMGEAFANLRQRNQFATLTSIGLLALLWEVAQGAVQARSVPRSGRWLLWGAAALLLAAGNAASGSRTGLFQWWLVAGLALLWWRVLRTRSAAATPILLTGLGALGLYCLAVVVLPVLLEWATGFQSGGLMGRFKEEVGCQSRRVLWSNVLYLIAQKPWTGWGWNELGYAHFVTLYPGQRFCDILDNAHNLPLHLAVELGVPLALTVCAALLWLVLRARPWQESDATRQLAWGVLAVIGLHSLLEYPLWYGPFQLAAGLSVWLLILPQPLHRFMARARMLYCLTAIVLIAMLTCAGWDYWRVSQLYVAHGERAPAYRDNTLDAVRNTLLFRNQMRFAELTTTPLTPENARHQYAMAEQLLHFSPEPRVVEKLMESATALGNGDARAFYAVRYKAAFPANDADWIVRSGRSEAP
jgi:O-antigen ligase